MSGHIIFEGVDILNISDEIQIKKNTSYSSNNYVGGTGSNTSYISESGKILTFSSICLNNEESLQGNHHRLDDYIILNELYHKISGVVTSPSNANINGNYIITKFDITEDTNNNFKIDWELTEEIPFNVTQQTFRVWGRVPETTPTTTTPTTTTTTTKVVTSGSTISSNTKYLLKTCGTMSKGSKATKCVKVLQKFLQAGGFYKGYKIDGIYGVYTVKEMKKAQKKRGLKQTGNWDKATRSYYQKKYKYP